ncbi:MAG: 1-deoxy-D-xylulose-5-phosphate synthase [Ruminococcaceae bacterium]|nr:1-deoxy-D-xylulose-5-phosphate synthase [Oscillospiraceae bacterium]
MESFEKWQLLAGVDSPSDLKALPEKKLPQLAAEIRDYLSYRVRENGGHLASNLGVVELTVAIHRVFSVPHDHVIFDVGHQSYVHKLLTGRKSQFDTLRMPGGLSGFTKREESECDAFGAGHSSTAISAAIGMAEADALSGSDAYTVAVVGDGALTGGLAYEGLNNCRRSVRMIIIVNENEMSISPNTGRLAKHLCKLRVSKNYLRTKEVTAWTLRHIPLVGRPVYKLVRRVKRRVRRMIYDENLFQHMGLRYLGPIDGNDIAQLVYCLEYAKSLECSVILHVKTKKGMGDAEAEADPNYYHGIAPRTKEAGEQTFSQLFGKTLTDMARRDERICAITAAMSCGTGLESFRLAHPRRFFDVGIAEGHAVTFAAGLAAGNMRPVVAVYSTFLQRAYDQILHDAALQHLPVVLCIDRAGFNAADGMTHHGVYDVALLSGIEGVSVYAPVTYAGLAASLEHALGKDSAVSAIRYPSGGENTAIRKAFYGEDGQCDMTPTVRVWQSDDKPRLTVVTHGRIAAEALHASELLLAKGVGVRILLCEYLAPYAALAGEVAPLLAGDAVLFYEEEIRKGGFGMNLADCLAARGAFLGRQADILAAESGFLGAREGLSMYESVGVGAADLLRRAEELLERCKGEVR